jgi:hypothetical protein
MDDKIRDVPSSPAPPAGLTAWDRKRACTGYTIYCHMRGKPLVYLVDMRGEPVHTWDVGLPPHYAELLPNGNIIVQCDVPDTGASVISQTFMGAENRPWVGAGNS